MPSIFSQEALNETPSLSVRSRRRRLLLELLDDGDVGRVVDGHDDEARPLRRERLLDPLREVRGRVAAPGGDAERPGEAHEIRVPELRAEVAPEPFLLFPGDGAEAAVLPDD